LPITVRQLNRACHMAADAQKDLILEPGVLFNW
jgi:hypothetical protein